MYSQKKCAPVGPERKYVPWRGRVGETYPGGTRGGEIGPSGADSVTQERKGPRHGQGRTQGQAQAGPVR